MGRYELRVFAPSGTRTGGTLSKPTLDTYGYDEDEDGVNMGDAAFGSDADAKRDHFTAIYYSGDPSSGVFTPDTKVTAAFRRTNDPLGFSVLDYAMAAGQGATSEFETMRRVHRYVSQQRAYGGSDRGAGDISSWIVPTFYPPSDHWLARLLGKGRLPHQQGERGFERVEAEERSRSEMQAARAPVHGSRHDE